MERLNKQALTGSLAIFQDASSAASLVSRYKSTRLGWLQVAASLGQVETASSPIGLSAAQLEELTSAGHLDSLDPKQQICFDFTKGLCTRGEACKYSHDIALIVKVNSQERGICFDFLRGQCSRGLLCRFSHDLSNITSQSSQVMQQGHPPLYCQAASIVYPQ